MKLKVAVIVVLLLLGAGAVFVALGGLPRNGSASSTLLTAVVTRGDVIDEVAATGTVAASASYGLAFGSPARPITDDGAATSAGSSTAWHVSEVSVRVGDAVKAGAVLATADTTDLERELTLATANVRVARIQRTIAEEALDGAETTDAKRQAKMDLYTAQNRVIEAEQTYADLTAQIGSPTVVAPVDGIVTHVNVVAGLDAPSGDAVVIDATGFRLTADVVENDVSSIGVGQAATVTVDAIDAEIGATVTAIAPVASSAGAGGIVSFAVTVGLDDPPAALRPGMTADVTITTATATNVLRVPVAALGGANGAYTVQVVDASGAAQTRAVTVGLVTASFVEITAGLAEGETVVTGTINQQQGVTGPGGGLFPGGFPGRVVGN